MTNFGLICNERGLQLFNRGNHEAGSNIRINQLFTMPRFDDNFPLSLFFKAASNEKVENVIVTLTPLELRFLNDVLEAKASFTNVYIVFLAPVPEDAISTCKAFQLPYFVCSKKLRIRKNIVQFRQFIHWKLSSIFSYNDVPNVSKDLENRIKKFCNSDERLNDCNELTFQFQNLTL
jgi:hypothetical protein